MYEKKEKMYTKNNKKNYWKLKFYELLIFSTCSCNVMNAVFLTVGSCVWLKVNEN